MNYCTSHVRTGPDGVLSRRTFLRSAAAGAALGALGWRDAVSLHAAELRKQGLACILLYMRGGPSQFETFDPKPGTATGGPTQAIATAAADIRIAAGWEKTAQVMNEIALIRSMTSKEGEHQRATYQMHTGYVPLGSIKYPSFGAIVASELAPEEFDLPHVVSIGGPRAQVIGSGFLGMQYAPFVVTNPNAMPTHATLPGPVTSARFGRRLGLLKDLEEDFASSGGKPRVEAHRAVYDSAARLVVSPRLKAFDLNEEKSSVRDRYGRSAFGQGCLLARRLIEAGVTFVEVESNGWDTHQENFTRTKTLAEGVDPALAALITELKERGRLDRTLVIWTGEFGRTPRINPNTGRDHYPRAFSVALAGAGIKGGRVIGSTNATGTDVADRPVTVADLFCTFCHALKINPRKENIGSFNRPFKIVDGGAPVKELFT